MSLARLVYYSAVIGGWAAFVGWLIAELVFIRSGAAGEGYLQVALVTGVVGATIGTGLAMVAGLANGNWKQLLLRGLPGLVGGGVGGVVGGILGNFLFDQLHLPRALGFLILGLAVGVVEGLYDRSTSKLRNGLIGGGIGGLIGGFLFDPVTVLLNSETGMASRATAFVILGLSIGALIGLVQVVLREAWLTVLDGYGTGRQLILSQAVTPLGRGDHLPLPFLGQMNRDLDAEHCRLVRQANGTFEVHDNQSKLGTSVNHEKVSGSRALNDGDVIKLGTNFVRFNVRRKLSATAATAASPGAKPAAGAKTPPPPPPPPNPAGQPSVGSTPVASAPASKSPAAAPNAPSSPRPATAANVSTPKPKGPPPPPPSKRKAP